MKKVSEEIIKKNFPDDEFVGEEGDAGNTPKDIRQKNCDQLNSCSRSISKPLMFEQPFLAMKSTENNVASSLTALDT